MGSLQELLDRLRQSWQTMSFNQRAIVGTVAVAALVSAVIFGLWVKSDTMVVLYSKLDPSTAAEVVDALSSEGAKMELRDGGRTVLVPASERDRLDLVMRGKGIVDDGHMTWDDFFEMGSMGATQRELDVRERRALEGELARSIESLDAVERARVHINQPASSVYVRERARSTASVVLGLRRRAMLEGVQVAGIQSLVANAVEGLAPEDVTVTDTATGRILSSAGGNSASGRSSEQLRAQQEFEQYLSEKASAMLADILGPGSYVVRVGADLDFEELERVSEVYDPATVVRSEGTAESEDPTKSRGVVNYEVNKTVDRILRHGSTLRKLTVSVAVDGVYEPSDDPEAPPAYVPRSEEELAQIERMVAGAVGLDRGRGDTIEVVNLQFHMPEPVAPHWSEQLQGVGSLPDVIGRIVLFIVAAVMLMSLRKAIAQALKTEPKPVRATNQARREGGGDAFQGVNAEVATLEDWTRGNPDQVAELVKAFARQED